MGATSKIWLLGIVCLYIIYLCWLLWIPGEGGMQPWLWSEETFNQNSSPFCDFLKVFQKKENIAGFLSPFSAVLMFCSLWIASEGWWLLLQFGWAVCKLPPPVALFATGTFLFWEKREFELCTVDVQAFLWGSKLSFTIAKLWGGCGTGLGRASELCRHSNMRRHWLCFRPVHCHMDFQESLTQQTETAVGLGCSCSAKSSFVVILMVALSSLSGQLSHGNETSQLSSFSKFLWFGVLFPLRMATGTVGIVWPL